MFGWRKKKLNFEWRKYVRTTILVRRQKRRDKIDVAKKLAVDQARAAGGAARAGAAKGAVKVGRGFTFTYAGFREILARPTVAGPLGLTALIALGAAAQRWQPGGPTREAVIPLAIGATLLLVTLPALMRIRIADLIRIGRGSALMLAVAAAGVGALGWLATRQPGTARGGFSVPTLASFSPFPNASTAIAGKARALSGQALKVGATTVELAGLEAPSPDQRCAKAASKKTWRCGEAARAALEKIVRGKSVTCDAAKTDATGRVVTSCAVEGRDVGGELVGAGHVFANGGILTQYGRLERSARSAKAGIWSGGEVVRPSEARARVASNTQK